MSISYNKGLQPLVFEATFASIGKIRHFLFVFLASIAKNLYWVTSFPFPKGRGPE